MGINCRRLPLSDSQAVADGHAGDAGAVLPVCRECKAARPRRRRPCRSPARSYRGVPKLHRPETATPPCPSNRRDICRLKTGNPPRCLSWSRTGHPLYTPRRPTQGPIFQQPLCQTLRLLFLLRRRLSGRALALHLPSACHSNEPDAPSSSTAPSSRSVRSSSPPSAAAATASSLVRLRSTDSVGSTVSRAGETTHPALSRSRKAVRPDWPATRGHAPSPATASRPDYIKERIDRHQNDDQYIFYLTPLQSVRSSLPAVRTASQINRPGAK